MIRVGLVEDNVDFRSEVAFHLGRAGYGIAFEDEGVGIDELMRLHPCDLVVLDLGLPAEDGMAIAARLRATHPQLGLVMLTARAAMDDRLDGLQTGADAYLSKPVDMRELVAVIASVARRLGRTSAGAGDEAAWILRPVTLRLIAPSGRVIPLTVNETALLRHMARAGDEPSSRKVLALAIGHLEPEFDDRRLEVAFSRLRLKIEAEEPDSRVIRSARGRGYLFGATLRIDEGR